MKIYRRKYNKKAEKYLNQIKENPLYFSSVSLDNHIKDVLKKALRDECNNAYRRARQRCKK